MRVNGFPRGVQRRVGKCQRRTGEGLQGPQRPTGTLLFLRFHAGLHIATVGRMPPRRPPGASQHAHTWLTTLAIDFWLAVSQSMSTASSSSSCLHSISTCRASAPHRRAQPHMDVNAGRRMHDQSIQQRGACTTACPHAHERTRHAGPRAIERACGHAHSHARPPAARIHARGCTRPGTQTEGPHARAHVMWVPHKQHRTRAAGRRARARPFAILDASRPALS